MVIKLGDKHRKNHEQAGGYKTAGIWIPFHEVYRHDMKRKADITKRVRRELGLVMRKESEPVCFMKYPFLCYTSFIDKRGAEETENL